MNEDKISATRLDQSADIGALVLRIGFVATFFMHGLDKLRNGLGQGVQDLIRGGLPGELMYFSYISEVLAPILIWLGVLTRLSTLTVMATMITILVVLPFPAGLGVHGEWTFEVQLLYLVVALTLFFIGPGRYRVLPGGSTRHWLLN